MKIKRTIKKFCKLSVAILLLGIFQLFGKELPDENDQKSYLDVGYIDIYRYNEKDLGRFTRRQVDVVYARYIDLYLNLFELINDQGSLGGIAKKELFQKLIDIEIEKKQKLVNDLYLSPGGVDNFNKYILNNIPKSLLQKREVYSSKSDFRQFFRRNFLGQESTSEQKSETINGQTEQQHVMWYLIVAGIGALGGIVCGRLLRKNKN